MNVGVSQIGVEQKKKAASWKINVKQKKGKQKIAFQSSASAMERRNGGQY